MMNTKWIPKDTSKLKLEDVRCQKCSSAAIGLVAYHKDSAFNTSIETHWLCTACSQKHIIFLNENEVKKAMKIINNAQHIKDLNMWDGIEIHP